MCKKNRLKPLCLLAKNTNLDQIITSKNPYLDQIITSSNPNFDQLIASQHIYIYAVKLLSGPSLVSLGVIIWAKLFLAYKNSGFKRFVLHTQLSFCAFLCPIIWQFSKNSLFQKKRCKIWVFQISLFTFIF